MSAPDSLDTTFETDRAGIASIIGVTVNHVNKLVSRGMPRASRGVYSIPACVQWYLEHLRNTGAIDPDEMTEVVAARVELYKEQATKHKLDNAVRAGQVIERDIVEDALISLCSTLVSEVENLPSRAARDCAATANEEAAVVVLREYSRGIREALGQRFKALAADLRNTRDGGAAGAESRGGGLGGP